MWAGVIIKTHVHGFFDTDLHKVSWHFATHKALGRMGSKFNWQSEDQCQRTHSIFFYPTLNMQIQPLNSLKTVSKVGYLFSMIPMMANCFGAFSQLHTIVLSHINFPQAVSSPNTVISSWVITTNCRLYSNISQILLLYKTWGYHNNFDSTRSSGYITDLSKYHNAAMWSMD